MVEVASRAVYDVLGSRAEDLDKPIIDYIINVLADEDFVSVSKVKVLLMLLVNYLLILVVLKMILKVVRDNAICTLLSHRWEREGSDSTFRTQFELLHRISESHLSITSVFNIGRELIQDGVLGGIMVWLEGMVQGKLLSLGIWQCMLLMVFLRTCQILHVEQEVVGDDTLALQCVHNADVERFQLLKEEARLVALQQHKARRSVGQDAVSEKLEQVYKRVEFIHADSAESWAASFLVGLSFTPEMQQKSTQTFSGEGECELLLLIHLDIHAVLWLETYLVKWPKDIYSCGYLLHLQAQKLIAYKGDYDAFERTREEQMKNQQKAFDSSEKAKAHMQFRYNAERASLRIMAIERLGTADEVINDPDYKFEFPTPYDKTRGSYYNYKFPGQMILDCRKGVYIDLVGPNGIGKSTILKLISGELQSSFELDLHQVNGLTSNPLLYMMRCYPEVPEQKLRSHLGSLGVAGNLALQLMYTLSGMSLSSLIFVNKLCGSCLVYADG
ncbi:hypothetical protein MKW92_011828 [Papaver armeniacum]|nr:hypothetical protein MKW92_011828 [Papaver armeniacum]